MFLLHVKFILYVHIRSKQSLYVSNLTVIKIITEVGLDVVILTRIGIQMSDWFGAPGCVKSGFVGTFIAECITHAAMTAESDWVGKARISIKGAAR